MFDKKILVTGGAGFIGANFVAYVASKYLNYCVIDLDNLTYAANRDAWTSQASMSNVVPVEGDIRNADLVRFLMRNYDITGVIHFAAESHVDNSIADPLRFVPKLGYRNTESPGKFFKMSSARGHLFFDSYVFL